MNEQQKTINFMLSIGYILYQKCCWPIYRNPANGMLTQVDFTGRQIFKGYDLTTNIRHTSPGAV